MKEEHKMTKKDMITYIRKQAREEFNLLSQIEDTHGFDSKDVCEQRAVWNEIVNIS